MVTHEKNHGERVESRADHREMAGRPHDLSRHLGVPRDTDDAGFPQVYLRLLDRRHLFQVEDGRIQEEEGDKIYAPRKPVDKRIVLAVPEDQAGVRVPDVVDDPGVRERERAGP